MPALLSEKFNVRLFKHLLIRGSNGTPLQFREKKKMILKNDEKMRSQS